MVKQVTLIDANDADRFHAIHYFCQDGLEPLSISTATSEGHESTIPRSLNLLKASREPSNRPPLRQSFASRWLLLWRARMLPPKADGENGITPRLGCKA